MASSMAVVTQQPNGCSYVNEPSRLHAATLSPLPGRHLFRQAMTAELIVALRMCCEFRTNTG
jgi:hypothetical protein